MRNHKWNEPAIITGIRRRDRTAEQCRAWSFSEMSLILARMLTEFDRAIVLRNHREYHYRRTKSGRWHIVVQPETKIMLFAIPQYRGQ